MKTRPLFLINTDGGGPAACPQATSQARAGIQGSRGWWSRWRSSGHCRGPLPAPPRRPLPLPPPPLPPPLPLLPLLCIGDQYYIIPMLSRVSE